jgi:hypothetical protein
VNNERQSSYDGFEIACNIRDDEAQKDKVGCGVKD